MLRKPPKSLSNSPNNFYRFFFAASALLICFWAIWTSGRAGFARRIASQVKRGAAPLTSADQAIRLSPSDPKIYYARGRALSDAGQSEEATKDFENAIALRPDDHLSWLRLGYDRDRSGDQQGALIAYQQAVRLAPYYAQPRWYLGNLLVRMGRRDEGFAQLRQAAASNPDLTSEAANRALIAYNGDADVVERVLQPQTSKTRLDLARIFVEHGNFSNAMVVFRTIGKVSGLDHRPLLDALLKAKRFIEAREVWAAGHQSSGGSLSGEIASITDGSFERGIDLDEHGFGWRVGPTTQGVRVSLDGDQPHAGAYSLRIDWNGAPDPGVSVISQLVVVEPKARYRLSLAARTQEALSLGLPIVRVTDASSDNNNLLGQSPPISRGTSGWQNYDVQFVTPETSSAVVITIRRQDCNVTPCPIFGHAWFDDFSLERF